MKIERNWVTKDLVVVSTSANRQTVAILEAILPGLGVHLTKPIFKLGQEIDESN